MTPASLARDFAWGPNTNCVKIPCNMFWIFYFFIPFPQVYFVDSPHQHGNRFKNSQVPSYWICFLTICITLHSGNSFNSIWQLNIVSRIEPIRAFLPFTAEPQSAKNRMSTWLRRATASVVWQGIPFIGHGSLFGDAVYYIPPAKECSTDACILLFHYFFYSCCCYSNIKTATKTTITIASPVTNATSSKVYITILCTHRHTHVYWHC